MAALRAAPLTSMLVEGNRVENCRGVTSRSFVSVRPVITPELGLIRCKICNAGRDNSGRHATKVAAAAAATATDVVAMARTNGAIRDMTDALQQKEQDYLDMIGRVDECVFCDVLTRSRSCYGSQNRVPAEKRSSMVGVESKKPLPLGSASWDLLD